jgi:hypothetical protein
MDWVFVRKGSLLHFVLVLSIIMEELLVPEFCYCFEFAGCFRLKGSLFKYRFLFGLVKKGSLLFNFLYSSNSNLWGILQVPFSEDHVFPTLKLCKKECDAHLGPTAADAMTLANQ